MQHLYLFLHLHYSSHHAQFIHGVQFWRGLLPLLRPDLLIRPDRPSPHYLVHPASRSKGEDTRGAFKEHKDYSFNLCVSESGKTSQCILDLYL